MKIMLVSVGTRGDMEPFLAIGEMLLQKGHQVICAFPEQYGHLVDGTGMAFASLGASYIALLESDAGRAAMGEGSGLEKFRATLTLARTQTDANKELVRNQYAHIEREAPDRIVYNSKATVPVIWEAQNPGKSVLISALPYMHYVREHAHVMLNRDLGPFVNRLTYSLADFGIVTTTMMSAGWLDIRDHVTRQQVSDVLRTGRVVYTISPSLFPRPDYWHDNMQVLGYHQRTSVSNWQPDPTLEAWLERHKAERSLFITFGSMTNPAPEVRTRAIVDILQRNQIPAIINTAAGGLVQLEDYDSDLIHFVSRIPYDWILPRMYGVMHHGGSGTTHLGLKYGCASMIVPHIIDQFVWGKKIAALGAGPQEIKVSQLTTDALEPKILDLMRNPAYKAKAEQLADQMATESFTEDLYQMIIAD